MIKSDINLFSDTQKSLLINSFIAFLWWLIFNPGFYSSDSFGVIEMARSGTISSDSTAIWAIAVKLLTINGSHPEIGTLFFSQLLTFSISLFAHSLFQGKSASWGSSVLCMTPLVGAMGITLWHDIPMTSGFLLVATGCIRYLSKKSFAKSLIACGLIFTSFRHNGIPTILVTLILLIIFFRPKKFFVITLILTIFVGGLTSSLDTKLDPKGSTHLDGLINWMGYDLSCYAATYSDEEFFQREFSGKATLEFWKSSQACNWFNDSQAFFKKSSNLAVNIPSAWLALALKKPLFILRTHMKRHEYLNPLPFFGPPSMPFLHTSIESAQQNIYFLNPNLSDRFRVYPRIWNYFNFIFGYSGLWLMIIFACAYRKKNPFYFGLGVLGLVLNSGLFVFAIISDARFSLFVLVSSQLVALVELFEYVQRKPYPKFFQRLVKAKIEK